MIIGVEKAGTTALFRHLAQSPLIYAHEQREMFYFLSDDEYKKGWEYACNKYLKGYEKGLIVAKSVMQINSCEAMIRLQEQCPDVKCIIMLREPTARAYSAYNYAVLRGAESCTTFEEALTLEDKRFKDDPKPSNSLLYLRNSTYAPKINAAFDIYGKDHVLVLYQEDYKENPRAQLAQVEALIGRRLFEGVDLDLRAHNQASKARYPWVAKLIFRFLNSQNPLRRSLRAMLPHDKAVKLRHAILNFNRIEAQYSPINEKTASEIREKLVSDRRELIKLIGYCPWGHQ